MKRFKRIICALIAVALFSTAFSGCSKSNDKVDFIYPFEAKINSFDPQVASTSDEFLVIENCFEGLVRVNDDGTVMAGVAKDWSISDDGLTYTFNLRQDAKWNIDTTKEEDDDSRLKLVGAQFDNRVTANDFVFALRRAVQKSTNAPLFSSVSNIVNASKIHSGKAGTDKLGVKAIDDYTLEIRLNSPDDAFLSVLSTAVAMPCNEAFFNATKGRYGLGQGYSVFNGQFYLSSILEASYILKNNPMYSGEYPSAVTDITLKIKNPDTETAKNLKSGYFDAAYISGDEYEQLKDSGISAIGYTDKLLAMILNKNNLIFTEKKLRQAMCLSLSDIDLSKVEHLERATGFTPPSCKIGSSAATDAIGNINISQNTEAAKKLWREGLEKIGASKADFTVITTEEYEPYVKQLVQGIQAGIGQISSYGDDDEKSISFSLKISVLSDEEYSTAIAKGEYDMAFYKFQATSSNPLNFLSDITESGFMGESSKAENALKSAQLANADKLAGAVKQCEKAMLDDYSVKPVMFESSYYAQAKGVDGVQFHAGSGRVCFVYATRED